MSTRCTVIIKRRKSSDPPPARGCFRFTLALKCVSATGFVEAGVAIASHRGAAARVRSHRNAGKLSWRRAVSLGGLEAKWSGTWWEFVDWDE